MIRHPHNNNNLNLHYESSYQGYPVQTQHGPLILEYLNLLHLTIQRALHEHPRVFAFRVDLRLPVAADSLASSNAAIGRFVESLKSKVRHNRLMARRTFGKAHDTTVRNVWAREGQSFHRPHFHLVVLLNNDAFHSLGTFVLGRQNLFNLLNQAWASALGLPTDAVFGLVEIPNNACYHLRRDDSASVAALFYRASYLCKADTKQFGNGCHGFGASRT